MCNRFTVSRSTYEIAIMLGVDPNDMMVWPPRYNVAPTQTIACLRLGANGREVVGMRWGLIPEWANEPTAIMNARSETAAEKPSFRNASRKRRCLIPADGFIEWETIGREKQPHWFRLANHEPFCFAGLWEPPAAVSEDSRDTATILTAASNADLSEYHDRTPVIIPRTMYDRWLNVENSWESLSDLLQALPEGSLVHHPVDKKLNSSKGENAEWLKPRMVQGTLFD